MVADKIFDLSISSKLVYQSDIPIKGKTFVKVFIDRVGEGTWEVIDGNNYQLINDSLVFTERPTGSLLIMQVATTPSELQQTPTDISLLLTIKEEIKRLVASLGELVVVSEFVDKVVVVANNIDAVSTVALDISEVLTVSADINKVIVVADNIAHVNNVGSIMAEVVNVSVNKVAVVAVSDNMASVISVKDNLGAINIVSDNIIPLSSIYTDIVPNLTEILQADANATIATTKASEASASATTATNQATITTTKANEASSSASSASNSAITATTKASEASASATSASNSATIATTKASEASGSASQALGYRNEALGFRNEAEAFNESKAFVVDTVEDLLTIPSSYVTAIVRDLNRGGTFIYDATKVSESNDGTNFSGWIRQYSGAVNVKWFGDIDSTKLQTIADSYTSIFFPSGDYIIDSEVIFKSSTNIVGENKDTTNIISSVEHSGATFRFAGSGRTLLENISFSTSSKTTVLYDSDGASSYPFIAVLRNVQIVNNYQATVIGSDYSLGGFGLGIEGVSHAHFDTVNVQSNNVATYVSSAAFNTGVFTFTNCFFGNRYTDNIGFWFRDGTALDSFTFNSCFFSGKDTAEQVGNGANTIYGITHNSCHYENSSGYANSSLVKCLGASGVGLNSASWCNCIFGGHSVTKNGFIFNNGVFQNITIINPYFTSLDASTGVAINLGTSSLFKNNILQGISIVGSGVATQFNDESKLFLESGSWFGGWTVVRDGFIDLRKSLKINGRRVSTIGDVSQLFYTYKAGDIFFKEALIAGGNKSFIGWVCTADGDKTNFKPFGLLENTPAVAAPTTGTYTRGERVYNTLPAPGGYLGWVCTASGTPGTWKGFGLIQA